MVLSGSVLGLLLLFLDAIAECSFIAQPTILNAKPDTTLELQERFLLIEVVLGKTIGLVVVYVVSALDGLP